MAGKATDATIAVRGFADLQRAIRQIEDGAEKELRQRVRDIGNRVALVAAANAPRMGPQSRPSDTSGFPGELQHSIKSSATIRGASVYSTAVYGGAINYGAWSRGRGPHISRGGASHYMQKAVAGSTAYVEQQVNELLDWAVAKFEER